MSFSLGVDNIKGSLIIFRDSVLEFGSKSSLSLSEVSKPLKVSLILVKLWSENQIALVGHVVDLLVKRWLNFILFSNFLSKLVVLVVSSINEFIEFLFKLFSSWLSLKQFKFVIFHFLVLQLGNEFLWLLLLLKADDFALKLRVLFDEHLNVGREFFNLKIKVSCKCWNLPLKVS